MLTCVCRPVSGNLPKMPPTMMPAPKPPRNAIAITGLGVTPTVVVTAEPKMNVPGRLTSAELRAMALRQQQQIDSQHQLLATKEQRLRFLKSQEVRNAVASAEGERLRRLRERVEAQESKLRRLRALRGQVDLQKTYNVTLSNDLDSIRALFSEKEKELSLAVAKVEALTRQLEDLRRDRRCPINLLSNGNNNGNAQPLPPQASRELEKLRRELVYRNQLSLQQDARLHLQREALQQRQAELRSVDQRIYELQTRLQRKKAANIQNNTQNQNQLHIPPHELHQQQQHQQQQQQQKHQPLQQSASQQQSQPSPTQAYSKPHINVAYNQQQQSAHHHKPSGVAALKQQLLQKQANNLLTTTQQQQNASKFPNIITREQNRNIPRGNVAAVEPYIHTPHKTAGGAYLGAGNILKHAAATANTNQQNQLIQDLTHMKHNITAATHSPQGGAPHNGTNTANAQTFFSGESDESKLAKKMLTASLAAAKAAEPTKPVEVDTSMHIYAEVGPKKRDLQKAAETAKAAEAAARAAEAAAIASTSGNGAATTTAITTTGSKIPKSISSSTSATVLISKLNSATAASRDARTELERRCEGAASEALTEKHSQQQQQLTVHSMPLGAANKSLATAVAHTSATTSITTTNTASAEGAHTKPKPLQAHTASGLAIPPRKPISSVAPTSVTSSIPKMVPISPKVNRVAPNVVAATSTATISAAAAAANAAYPDRPALPPKPSKMSPTEHASEHNASAASNAQATTTPATSMLKKPAVHAASIATAAASELQQATQGLQTLNINDNLPIKAKPLTIRKQPMCEQPRLKLSSNVPKPPLQTARKMDMPAASSFLYPADGSQRGERGKDAQDNSNNNNNGNRSTVSGSITSSAASSPEQLPQYSLPQVPPPATSAPTTQSQHSPNSNSQTSSSLDELDKIEHHSEGVSGIESTTDANGMKRRALSTGSAPTSSSLSSASTGNGKPKLARRVSFDPLALLLDASLEGELELVKKTAMQVANPSAANDEGITALHNAICAGHFDIVKFLVEFGCDVNAQDSDGWTPLHCAASCNNLSMVKFLVENGACLFASTLSDHETPAEKCEEDEEGFDGCSEYLYSIQEKLGILHNGEVYAVFSYDAQNSDELTFQVNDRLIILRKGDDAESEWWWAKNASDEEGYVPRNLLGLYPRVPPQTSNFND
ncbi:apoptosis-stimulating of p53 protein 2 isoform X1 [Bactrocera neohumeralis]|uniref:apoptosis-stimulating of p53 protein 2 isoform X1 n=1 Tax=Bactrocera neohumeralis TaxID=98809 RepID=UPI002165B3FC|nr:apoptosis-stimulating of p53 protein 2 isoform X1 [Bactrocera neohumeralis]XP_050322822.1 apoptosis-stimulating of p53 protein 2 isoform X1 [Bactrocera neohumeralis]